MTFQEDWESAQREVFGMPDLPTKKKQSRQKKSNEPRLTKMTHRGPAKKVLSENAKAQPRQAGKFAKKKVGIWTRLSWLFNGKARRKVNSSIRAENRRNAKHGIGIPMEKRKRRTRRRRTAQQPAQQTYRKSIIRQLFSF